MKPIISVEGLGKKYVIRHEGQTHYKSLREEIFQLPKKLFSRQDNKEEFWALKDVSFDIMPGDRVGIIGRNGAGKSTLLKLLSRITEPSAGRITMRGRVASLLEVGTGFHPELTGRENIYLNGAILGMSRAEVRRKFDEIVEFSGVEKFLDTPVKRYSSGMYVRLAFAVAAHLEPEILIVDEVLAVGDVEFQKKCLGKMEDVGRQNGRTVLFVSHNMAAVKSLCTRVVVLADGGIAFDADTQRGVAVYADNVNNIIDVYVEEGKKKKNYAVIEKVWTEMALQDNGWIRMNVNMQIRICEKGVADFFISVNDLDGTVLSWVGSKAVQGKQWTLSVGTYLVQCSFERLSINAGEYLLGCGIVHNGSVVEDLKTALRFKIQNVDPYNCGFNLSKEYGFFNMSHAWSVE